MREMIYFLSGIVVVLVGVGGAIWVLLKGVEKLRGLVGEMERGELSLLSGILIFIVGLGYFTVVLGIIGIFTLVGVGFIDVNLRLALLGLSLAEALPFDTVAFPMSCGSLALLCIFTVYAKWVKEEEWGYATRLTVVGLGLLLLYSVGGIIAHYMLADVDSQSVWANPWVLGPILMLIWIGISSFGDPFSYEGLEKYGTAIMVLFGVATIVSFIGYLIGDNRTICLGFLGILLALGIGQIVKAVGESFE